MNQTIKTTIASLTLTLALFTGNVATFAQTNTYYSENVFVTNAVNGLNLRGLDCKVKKVLAHKTVLTATYFSDNEDQTLLNAPNTKTCSINGKNVNMKLVSSLLGTPSYAEGYVAESFLSKVISNKAFDQTNSQALKADASSGLNVRDGNCKKIGTVPNNYTFNNDIGGIGGAIKVCEVNNTYYDMVFVPYKGQWALAARVFLK